MNAESNILELEEHSRTHNTESKKQMRTCNAELEEYIRTHNTELKKHMTTFTSNTNLQTHMRTHTDNKAFQCDTCCKAISLKH